MAQYIKEPSYRKDKKLPDFIQRGKVLILRRQFQEAVKVCRLGLLAHPTYVEGRLVLGMALIALTRYDEVMAEMRVALEVDPQNSMAYQLKGEALFYKGDYLHAQEVLSTAQQLDPHNVKVQKLIDKLNEISASGAAQISAYKTDTKVYPAQKAQDIGPDREPSEVLDSYKEWGSQSIYSVKDAKEQEREGAAGAAPSGGLSRADQSISGLVDDPSTLRNAQFQQLRGEDQEEEDFTTAPFIAPTYLVHKLPQQRTEDSDWDDPTFSENQPGYPLGDDDPEQEMTEQGEGLAMSFSSLHPQPDPEGYDAWDDAAEDPDTVRDSGVDGLLPDTTQEGAFALGHEEGERGGWDPPTDLDDETARQAERDGAIPTQDMADAIEQFAEESYPEAEPPVDDDLADEDDDEETMVNAEAPPPEALFGESSPVLDPYASDPSSRVRKVTDPTKALVLDQSIDQIESQVERSAIRGDEVYEGDDGNEDHDGGEQFPPGPHHPGVDRYQPPDAADVRVVSGVEVEAEGASDEYLPLKGSHSDSMLAEISVVMLPDELEMPPIPEDVSHPSVLDAEGGDLHLDIDSQEQQSLEAAQVVDDDDEEEEERDSQTRVHFEIPDKKPDALDPPASEEVTRQPSENVLIEEQVTTGEILGEEPSEHDGLEQPRGYGDDGQQQLGYADDEYGRHGYADAGLEQPGYVDDGLEQPGYVDDGLEQPGYIDDGLEQPGYAEDGYGQPGYAGDGYGHPDHAGEGSREQQSYVLENGVVPDSDAFQDIYYKSGPGEAMTGDLAAERNPFWGNPAGYEDSLLEQSEQGLELPSVPVYEPQHGGDPVAGMLPHQLDDEELAVEPADLSGRQPPGAFIGRTELSQDEGRAMAYVDGQWPPNAATEASNRGSGRGQREHEYSEIAEDGESRAFLREAAARVRKAKKKQQLRDKTATSILTLLIGGPGSYRWVFFLLSSIGVLVLAVGIGLAVRYFRLGEQIETKRQQAESRLRKGNLPDFTSAAQYYTDILSRRPDDEEAIWAKRRIQAAIPFEFGDPITQAKSEELKSKTPRVEQIAAMIYIHLNNGSLAEANKVLSGALSKFPDSALINYLCGRIRLLEGNGAAAVKSLEQAREADPKNTLVLRSLGDAIAVSGKSGPAMELYRQALEVNSDHIGTLLNRAHLRHTLGRGLKEAEEDLQSILMTQLRKQLASRGQQGWAYLIMAKLEFRRRRMGFVKKFISSARSHKPTSDAPFMDALASLLIETFHLGEATKWVERSKEFMRDRPQPFYIMAQIHQRHGLPKSALLSLEQAKGIEFAQANVLRAQINLELGNLQVAAAEVERALGMSDLVEAHIVKAKVMAARGQGERAAELLKRLLHKNSDSAKLLTALGEVYLSMKKIPEAKEKFNEALRKDKHSFDAQLKLAQVYELEGNFKEARNQLGAASRGNYGNIYALKELARLEADTGDLIEAATDYLRLITSIPNDPQARLALAAVYTAQRKYKEAHEQIRLARKNNAERGALALAKGRLALRQDRIDEAIEQLTLAKSSQKKSSEPWELLILANIKKGDNEQAVREALRELTDKFPEGPEAEIEAGRVDLEAGRPQPALARFHKAIKQLEHFPRPPTRRAEIHVLLARVYLERGQMRKAEGECKQAIEVCPICPMAFYYLGRVQEQRKARSEAYKSYHKAIALDPKLKDAYFDLAWMYEVDGQISKAIENMKRYIPLETNKEVRDTAERDLKGFEERL